MKIRRVAAMGQALRVAGMCLLVVLAARPVQAQTEAPYDPGFAREGVYVGVGGSPSLTFKADQFAGDYGYVSEDDAEIFVIPSVNKRPVARVVVGLRSRPLALEFSYDRARFTGDHLGLPLVSTYNAINVDAKFFFRNPHQGSAARRHRDGASLGHHRERQLPIRERPPH